MAYSHTPTYVGAGAFTSGTAALTVAIPAGYRNNDLFLLVCESANQAITAPTGWTEVGNQTNQATGTAAVAGGVRLAVFWKIASGNEASVTVADSGDHTTGQIFAFRGVDPANPFGSATPVSKIDSTATTAMSWPTLTTTTANNMIVMAAGLDADVASTAAVGPITAASLTSISEKSDNTVIAGAGGGITLSTGIKAAAGAIGTMTATGSTSTTHGYLTLALQGRSDAIVNPRGQYRLLDMDTVVPTGGQVVTANDGIMLQADVSPAYELDNAFTPKLEAVTTASSLANTATVTNSTYIADASTPTYSARGGTLVHDLKNDRYLYFGGYDGTTRYNQVWAKDMSRPAQPWRKLNPTGTAPTAKNLAGATYFRGNKTTGGADTAIMIVWGGNIGASDTNEMHILDVTTPGSEAWTVVTQTSAPTARSYITKHLVATPHTGDTSQTDVYLFGGWATNRENQLVRCTVDLDALGTVTWTTLKATGTAGNPTIRSGCIMDYKASTNKLYIYGGYSGTAYLNDFWSYDIAGNTFAQETVTGTGPQVAELGAGGYDAANNRFWFAGGWNAAAASGTHNHIGYINSVGSSASYLTVRADDNDNQAFAQCASVASTIDTKRGWLVMYSMQTFDSTERYSYAVDLNDGITTYKPVYGLNDGDWMTARDAPASVWDPDGGEWLVIDGFADMGDEVTIATGSHQNDIYAYNPNTNQWRYANKGYLGMIHTEGATAVYDTTRDRVIVFGGLSGISETHNEVWSATRDANGMYKWARLTPTGTLPVSRWLTHAVFDSANNRVLYALGGDKAGQLNEVWELSFASSADGAWTQRTPTGTVTAVVGAGFANKASNTRLYIFGGATAPNLATVSSQLIYLDYSTTNCAWTTPTSSAGVARRTPALGYDPVNDRLIAFTGFNGTASINTMSFWDVAAGGAWVDGVPPNIPDARRSAGYAFINDALYITHGRSDSSPWYRNTWKLIPFYGTPASSSFTNMFPRMFVPQYFTFDPNTTGSYHWQSWITEETVDQTKVSYPQVQNTYYFNASDAAATDPGGVFTNDANAFDGLTTTSATWSSLGSTASNYLMAEGTNAPTSGGTIVSVQARIIGSSGSGASNYNLNAAIYTDGLGALLGTPTAIGAQNLPVTYNAWATLSIPAGGWTWQKINDLEVKIYATGSAVLTKSVQKVELLVTSSNSDTVTADTDFQLGGAQTLTRTHTTDSLKRKQSTVSHTTSANKKKTATVSHTTDSRRWFGKAHTTDALKTVGTTVTTNTYTTQSSADDGQETVAGGAMNITATSSQFSRDSSLGFRFPNVTIPQGTTITAAYIKFLQLFNYSGFSNILGSVYAEKSSNAAQFTTTAGNISGRTKTTAKVTNPSADNPAWTTGNGLDITAVMQEVFNQGTWASGNAAAVLMIGDGTGASALFIEPYMWDYTTGFYPAQLIIQTTTSAARQMSRYHTTDAYTHIGVPTFTKTHTTDSFKRIRNTKTHTTDSLKRKQNTVTHTTSANKKKTLTVSHTTDANKKKTGITVVHTTDSNKKKAGLTRTHTTDALKRVQTTKTHTTDSLKRKQFSLTHTTDSLKRKQFTLTHTADANKKRTYTASHTADANKKKTGNTKFHTTDANKRVTGITRTHTTDALKRKQFTSSHTTDSLKRTQNTRAHTTDANKKKALTVSHTTDTYLKKVFTKTHTTDSNKRRAYTVVHTTDANKKKTGLTVSHTTDANKKKAAIVVSHTTDSFKRRQLTLTHTTDSNKKRAYTVTHTADTNKKKTTTKTHTTDANKKVAGILRTHTTDSLKRKQFTLTHTTDSLKRTQTVKTHTTDALKRKQFSLTHTTDSNKKKTTSVTHTTDAFKRTRNTRVHTTDANKRKALTVAHTTDSLKRKQFTQTHTTDAYLSLTATVGPNNPGTATDSGSGFDAWVNPGNVFTSNDAYATSGMGINASFSNFLRVSNFGFVIPAGATINGIKVEIERKGNSTITDKSITLMKNLVSVGTDKADTVTTWPTSDAYATYGSASDVWGTTWTVNDINNANFGVSIQAKETGGFNTASIDHVRISVTYTPGIPKVQHTTDANKRKVNTLTHTTSANKKVAGNTRSHTTDTFKVVSIAAGPRSPGTAADSAAVGTITWNNTGNILTSDNTYSDASAAGSGGTSHYLKGTNFGFAIPSTATIRGIVVEIEKHASASTAFNYVQDSRVSIIKSDGSVGTTNKGDAVTKWTTTDSYISYGSSTDLWGETWTYADINDIDFGVALSALLTVDTAVSAFVDHMRITVYYTTPTPTFTATHTTDSLKRKQLTVSHTTDSNKKKTISVSHTTDANKKKAGITVVHTTDANKKKAFTAVHTTDSLKRTQNTRTHTTDSLKRKQFTKTHTTDSFLRRQRTATHTTDANKKRTYTVLHTTDANKKKTNTVFHSTDSLKRRQLTLTHTTDALKKQRYTPSHTTDALKRKQNTITHTTSANKRKVTTVTHTTDANKRKVFTVSHTTDSLKRRQIAVTHTTDTLKRRQLALTHTTDALKRTQNTRSHTTDSLLRRQLTRTHTTDALKRRAVTITHTTDAFKRAPNALVHSTDANKRRAYTVTHTTDSNKKKAGITRFHTTDANKRVAGIVRTHTTDALKRTQNVKTHTTDALKRTQNTKTHTTDTLKRKQFTLTHSTDSNKRKALTVSHTTSANKKKTLSVTHTADANKRKTNTVSHSTDTLLRRQLVKTHTTDTLKRAQSTRTHTTDAFKRTQNTKTHTTDSNKRRAYTATHTTDANKRRAGITISHTTSANKRKAFTVSQTTDSLLRKQNVRTHTTDANKRKVTTVSHTTDTFKRGANERIHSTDANKRKALTVTHTTDANRRKALTVSHTTSSLLRRQRAVTHTTDALAHGDSFYTREQNPVLPTSSAPRSIAFTQVDMGTVQFDDSTYVDQFGAKYLLFYFERYAATNRNEIHITWNGKSTIDTMTRPVYLELYNVTTGLWETLDMNNSTVGGTDFTLSGTKLTGLSDYYDTGNKVVVRVYQ